MLFFIRNTGKRVWAWVLRNPQGTGTGTNIDTHSGVVLGTRMFLNREYGDIYYSTLPIIIPTLEKVVCFREISFHITVTNLAAKTLANNLYRETKREFNLKFPNPKGESTFGIRVTKIHQTLLKDKIKKKLIKYFKHLHLNQPPKLLIRGKIETIQAHTLDSLITGTTLPNSLSENLIAQIQHPLLTYK